MAQPIVDGALVAQLVAIDGSWCTTPISPMRLQLGTSMLVDMARVRVDERSYYDMDKCDDAANLQQCKQAWKSFQSKRVSAILNNKTPAVKKAKIELNQHDSRKENKNGNKKSKGELDNDEVTVDGATAKMMKFVEYLKEGQRVEVVWPQVE
jgi:hypothetical protein